MKIRADQLLVKKGKAVSRHEAQSLILAGQVYSARGRVEKAGQAFEEGTDLAVRSSLPFVSRGGTKLDHALRKFSVDVRDKTCLDVGASTGGFTDCLLQRGAKKIYAVDVGYGQLHWKLRQDPRLVIFERTNFRYFDPPRIPEVLDLAVVDVSFISLDKIIPRLPFFLKEGSEAVVLVKPQFELSPAEVKKGVVRSDALRKKAVLKIVKEAARIGFLVEGQTQSPLEGPKGNAEYFLHLRNSLKCATIPS